MNVRLFCDHCDKFFEVDTDDVKLAKETHNDFFKYANNTYYFDGDCFCKVLNQIKRSPKENEV